jgi:hypothetical protein
MLHKILCIQEYLVGAHAYLCLAYILLGSCGNRIPNRCMFGSIDLSIDCAFSLSILLYHLEALEEGIIVVCEITHPLWGPQSNYMPIICFVECCHFANIDPDLWDRLYHMEFISFNDNHYYTTRCIHVWTMETSNIVHVRAVINVKIIDLHVITFLVVVNLMSYIYILPSPDSEPSGSKITQLLSAINYMYQACIGCRPETGISTPSSEINRVKPVCHFILSLSAIFVLADWFGVICRTHKY